MSELDPTKEVLIGVKRGLFLGLPCTILDDSKGWTLRRVDSEYAEEMDCRYAQLLSKLGFVLKDDPVRRIQDLENYRLKNPSPLQYPLPEGYL